MVNKVVYNIAPILPKLDSTIDAEYVADLASVNMRL